MLLLYGVAPELARIDRHFSGHSDNTEHCLRLPPLRYCPVCMKQLSRSKQERPFRFRNAFE